MSERILNYGHALREAQAQSMAQDPRVLIMGEGVDDAGGLFGSTQGLHTEFGGERCFDTPLAEEGITGIVNGAALCGLRPVLVHARVEFMLLAMNQMLTHAAQWRSIYGPQNTMPVVYRSIIGRGWGQGAQHSQALSSIFLNTPGIHVVMPSTPADAKGLLCQAIAEDDPVVFMEHRQLYGIEEPVDPDYYTIPFGVARVHREGSDVTIVAFSQMVHEALTAADHLASRGINAEVIDPRTLAPLDMNSILESVARTGRLVVVENGWTFCGVSAEIAARCAEELLDDLSAPVARIGFPRCHTPSSHVLEQAYYPNWEVIASRVEGLLGKDQRSRKEQRDGRSFSESW